MTCVMAIAACGGGGDGSKVFGEHDTACPPTVLLNEPSDEIAREVGVECFLAEYEAGRPVVWDVLIPTVEGDPLLWRYDFGGESVTITGDLSRDEFGNSGVTTRRCEGVERGPGAVLPEGVGCESTSGDGFRSDSLPTG